MHRGDIWWFFLLMGGRRRWRLPRLLRGVARWVCLCFRFLRHLLLGPSIIHSHLSTLLEPPLSWRECIHRRASELWHLRLRDERWWYILHLKVCKPKEVSFLLGLVGCLVRVLVGWDFGLGGVPFLLYLMFLHLVFQRFYLMVCLLECVGLVLARSWRLLRSLERLCFYAPSYFWVCGPIFWQSCWLVQWLHLLVLVFGWLLTVVRMLLSFLRAELVWKMFCCMGKIRLG